jgi:hypothetical protein
MGAKNLPAVSDLARRSVSNLSPVQRADVLRWANQSLVVIHNNKISKAQKVTRLRRIRTPKAKRAILIALMQAVKGKAWDDQSWARRFALVGLLAGAAAFGGQGAGIAAMGGAVGVPLALLSTIGGTFLGALVDELQKEKLPSIKVRSKKRAVTSKKRRQKQLR